MSYHVLHRIGRILPYHLSHRTTDTVLSLDQRSVAYALVAYVLNVFIESCFYVLNVLNVFNVFTF